MKKIITLLLISTNLFSQIIVHSKNDPRLLAYNDSMACYICGLKQLDIANKIKDRNDISEGRIAMNKINGMMAKLNPKIKFISYNKQLMFVYNEDSITIGNSTYVIYQRWMPDIYKKPVCRVIYEPEERIIKHTVKKDVIVKTDTIKKPTIKNVFVYTLNGQVVNREQFERVYGRKTCSKN